jgi:hypothetical protein
MPVPIPKVLGHADDLGGPGARGPRRLTLQAHLGAAAPASTSRSTARRSRSSPRCSARRRAGLDEYLPYRIAFDVEKLTWEMDFFVKHFIEAYRGIVISPAVTEALAEEFGAIVEELASERACSATATTTAAT